MSKESNLQRQIAVATLKLLVAALDEDVELRAWNPALVAAIEALEDLDRGIVRPIFAPSDKPA